MNAQRKTISTNVSISGIGLHSGIYTTVELRPRRRKRHHVRSRRPAWPAHPGAAGFDHCTRLRNDR
jgi:UDP-3-O-acyl-N-acetylglucosamine deacetylase